MDPSPLKNDVRRELRAGRRATAQARDRDADDLALTRQGLTLVRSLGLGSGSTVTLYEAWAGEPPTAGLLGGLQARGIRVLLPITDPDLDLDWYAAHDPARTPLGKNAIGVAELILAPGLAVDHFGTRLGQGGGCYDKALPRRHPGVKVVTMLHPGELVEGPLPRESHDQCVDGVLTCEGVTWLPGATAQD